MSIKEAMQKYFQMREKLILEGLGFLGKTPFNDDVLIYEGKADEAGYISWQPVEMTETRNFVKLQNEFNIQLHKSIIDYFNSYWFADLDGFYKDYYIVLAPILPSKSICSFRETLKGYKASHADDLAKIPIGIEGNGLLVVIENDSGIIQLEDVERHTYEYIADNLQALIGSLRLVK